MLKLSALLFIATTAPAIACTPPKIIGMDYHAARAKLIQAGCAPVAYDPATEGNPPIHAMRADAMLFGYAEVGIATNSTRRAATFAGLTVSIRCENLADPRLPCKVERIKHH
jgi:hypothetical protein